jgi:hypothetical protein
VAYIQVQEEDFILAPEVAYIQVQEEDFILDPVRTPIVATYPHRRFY